MGAETEAGTETDFFEIEAAEGVGAAEAEPDFDAFGPALLDFALVVELEDLCEDVVELKVILAAELLLVWW